MSGWKDMGIGIFVREARAGLLFFTCLKAVEAFSSSLSLHPLLVLWVDLLGTESNGRASAARSVVEGCLVAMNDFCAAWAFRFSVDWDRVNRGPLEMYAGIVRSFAGCRRLGSSSDGMISIRSLEVVSSSVGD